MIKIIRMIKINGPERGWNSARASPWCAALSLLYRGARTRGGAAMFGDEVSLSFLNEAFTSVPFTTGSFDWLRPIGLPSASCSTDRHGIFAF